jgi:DNA methylase/Helicase conserved C-terminal domain
MDSYTQFLATKRILAQSQGLGKLPTIHDQLFPFQKDSVLRALEFGKMAMFEECGLGKTIQQLEWSRHVVDHTASPVIVFTPLAVAEQTIREGELIDLEVRLARSKDDLHGPGVYVTNYQKLHLFDCSVFGGVVLDESSILKHQDGHYRTALIDSFSQCPFKLCCTATPSPNDFMELGNHAEFLDVMTRLEMLATFFTHDGGKTQDWRLKRHAVNDFWAWVASWSVAIRHPRDLGYEMRGFDLPPIRYIGHTVETDITPENAEDLFMMPASSLSERRGARKRSQDNRLNRVVELVNERPDELFILWCHTNAESEELAKMIPDAVEVTGSDSDEHKVKSLLDFADGKIRVLVSKASIAGWGLNLQRCSNAVFVSLSDSFEQLYQAVRRIYRFGQINPVNIHLVSSSLEDAVMRNIKRKADQHERMVESMINKIKSVKPDGFKYAADTQQGERWTMLLGDCVDVCKTIESDSIHFSIYSLPFSSLFTYSHSERDMGNTRGDKEFFEHYGFLVDELVRVMIPGRLVAVHCMNLPTSKERHGVIGIRDFRGAIIRNMEEHGFIYHSEVCIWKDPVTAMQRTKALGLLHKQLKKDSCMSRQGIADYLVVFRKPGDNPERVKHTNESFPVDIWQQYASPVWMDINPSDTLQRESAREHADERHIAPLQLQVIRRALKLWTNPLDIVLDPFCGIGSSGVEAIKTSRQFIGIELKRSYYDQSVANLRIAWSEMETLFNTHFREADIAAADEFVKEEDNS